MAYTSWIGLVYLVNLYLVYSLISCYSPTTLLLMLGLIRLILNNIVIDMKKKNLRPTFFKALKGFLSGMV